MAANSANVIRVRLYFDYPPPAVVDCRMCWLLVDLSSCRVVADLESLIREKFEFSPRSILNLFIEDCYLPHTERIIVVRDNDSVRVKVDSLAQVNGHSSCPDTSSKNYRKRRRPTEENGPSGNGVSVELKEKKRKKLSEEILVGDDEQASGIEKKKKKKSKEKCREKKRKAEENSPAAIPTPAVSTKKTPARTDQPAKSTKKPPSAQAKSHGASPSHSSSGSSMEYKAPKKPPAPKPGSKTPLSPSAASKAPPNTKPTHTKSNSTSSSSSETDYSSDEVPSVKNPPKNKPLSFMSPQRRINDNSKSQYAPSVLQSSSYAQKQANSIALSADVKDVEPCNSDSDDAIKLVIRQPMQQSQCGVGSQSFCRGNSQGRVKNAGLGDRGRGKGRGVIRGHTGSFDLTYHGAKESCYQTDSLINTSVVFQNGAESAPKQDYSSMPLLAAPPQVGQKIAFKLLELAENYTPEISEYKEGKIVSFDPTTKQIELELLHASQAPVEPGKFDLVYQNPDGSARVEYAVSRGAWVTEQWDSLLEPRLLI